MSHVDSMKTDSMKSLLLKYITKMVKVTWPIFSLDTHSHVSRTAEARVAKFYIQLEYIK